MEAIAIRLEAMATSNSNKKLLGKLPSKKFVETLSPCRSGASQSFAGWVPMEVLSAVETKVPGYFDKIRDDARAPKHQIPEKSE